MSDQQADLPLMDPFPEYFTCPNCGETEVEGWCYRPEVKCHSCGHVFSHPVPACFGTLPICQLPVVGPAALEVKLMKNYHFVPDLFAQFPPISEGTVVSKTIYKEDGRSVVLFGFAAGEGLTEHTSSHPAMIQFLSGRGTLTLGPDTFPINGHSWAFMPANLPHSITAQTDLQMMLWLF